MTIAAGIDLGTGCVKSVLFRVENGKEEMLAKRTDKIRQRDPLQLAKDGYQRILKAASVDASDVDYVASTGDGENLTFTTGHFYSMTTHARGAIYLNPDVRGVMDMGALNGRGIKIDELGKVLSYRMTSQCASGSGQFLENIARYLGISQEEIGSLSQQGDDPEVVSSICAVLAETDVINMVSRGITAPNILKGIHLSMAGRAVKLVRIVGCREGKVMMTGGLALDTGMVVAMNESFAKQKMAVEAVSNPDSIYAGAIGAAIWGAFRFEKLAKLDEMAKAS